MRHEPITGWLADLSHVDLAAIEVTAVLPG
jgi:hypothetical protein